MTSKRKFNSDALEAIHASATALFKVEAIDKATMRDFDETCLAVPPAISPLEIKRLREANKVSQPVFARYLNTSESTVENSSASFKSTGWRSWLRGGDLLQFFVDCGSRRGASAK